MRLSKTLSIVLVVLHFSACATYRVSVDYDPAINLATLKHYAWKPETGDKAGDLLIDTDTLFRQRVTNAIDGELTRRGYRKSENSPDFLVSFFYTRERKVDSSSLYYPYYGGFFGGPYSGYWGGWYYPGYYGGANLMREYDEGLLVIDFLNPRTRKLLWRGMVRDYIRFQEEPETRERRIYQSVAAALERFPPH